MTIETKFREIRTRARGRPRGGRGTGDHSARKGGAVTRSDGQLSPYGAEAVAMLRFESGGLSNV